jgi:hypothetical protein
VCGVLNGLVDWALEKQNFDCAQPVHHTDNDDACVAVSALAPPPPLKASLSR